MFLKLSIFLFIVKTLQSKLIEIDDKNLLKKELKSHANILIIFVDNERASADAFKLLNDIYDKASKISKLMYVNCKSHKKLCKQYKADSTTFVLQHYHKGKFNKIYDRKLNSKSLIRFLEDPTGDIPWEEDDSGKDVMHAKSSQDLQKLASSYKTNIPPLMLMFYAPWCGYCKKMKPEFGAAASATKGRAIFIGINGDITTTDDLKQAFNVTGYPSVFLVKEGKNIFKFDNENSKDALIKFVDNPTQISKPKDVPWSEETNEIDFLTDSNFEEYLSEHQSTLVMFYAPWCGHCKSMKPEVIEAVKQLKKTETPGIIAALDSTEQKNISTFYNITGFPTLKYFKDGIFQFDVSERTAAGLLKFMRDPQKPKEAEVQLPWNQEQSAVLHPGPQDFKATTKRYKHALVMFYAPWCGHCKKAKPAFTAAAEEMKDNNKVAYMAVDCTDKEYSGLCKTENVEGFPTIRYYNYGKVTSHSEYSLEREQDDFVAFMRDPSNPRLDARRHWKHIDGNEAIEVLQTETFSQSIVSRPGGALIMFYAPWCGHCNAMKPAFVAAAVSLKTSLPSCLLGTVDATAEPKLSSQYGVSGFPTLIYFAVSGEWSKYTGERGEKDITEFMLKKNREVRFVEEEKLRVEQEKEKMLKIKQEEEKRQRDVEMEELRKREIEKIEAEKMKQKEIERKELERKQKEETERNEIERKRQEKEMKQKEEDRLEVERKLQKIKEEERMENEKAAQKRQEEERRQKEKEENEKAKQEEEKRQKEKEEKERVEREKAEQIRQEEKRKEKEEKERNEKEKAKLDEEKRQKEKEEKERNEKEKAKQEEEKKQKEKEEKERKEREKAEQIRQEEERLEKERKESEKAEQKRQEEEREQKEEKETKQKLKGAQKDAEGMTKIESIEEFQSQIKSPQLGVFYFHKGDRKSHVRAKVLRFLQRESHARMAVRRFEVDCGGSLVPLCDDLGIAQLPSVLAFVDDRHLGTLSDSFGEEDLEHLIAGSVRDEL